jgi:hypothetical protein
MVRGEPGRPRRGTPAVYRPASGWWPRMKTLAAVLVTVLFLFLALVLARASVSAGVTPSQVSCAVAGSCDGPGASR